jgi:hypothetical protein
MQSTPLRPIQQSIRVNGDLQPKQVKISNFGNLQETGISAFSSNYLQFARTIQKDGKTEEVRYWQPANWRGMNNLPPETKGLKISLIVENPNFKTYRLTKVIDIEGRERKVEVLKFLGGKEETFADIQEFYNLECPVITGKIVRIIVRLDLLESSGIPGMKSLQVAELSYQIGRAGIGSEGKITMNARKGGDAQENY